jgi:hypothetical protein
MLCCVAIVRYYILVDCIASIFRVTRIGELGTMGAVLTYSCHPDDGSDTFLENVGSNRSHTEDSVLHSHCHENLKSSEECHLLGCYAMWLL